jgi:hypothetical protein
MAYAARPKPSKTDDCARRAMSGNSGLRKRLAARARSWSRRLPRPPACVLAKPELPASRRVSRSCGGAAAGSVCCPWTAKTSNSGCIPLQTWQRRCRRAAKRQLSSASEALTAAVTNWNCNYSGLREAVLSPRSETQISWASARTSVTTEPATRYSFE